jgi:hypothetical protein
MVRAAKAVCCVIQRAKTTIVGRQARITDSAIVLIGTIHGSVLSVAKGQPTCSLAVQISKLKKK